jgi:starvation-inducible DNA-binding protein
VAERGRKLGPTTIRSIGDITRFQRIQGNESSNVSPDSMLAVLCEDNRSLRSFMQETHALCDGQGDLATASLLENWIDETGRRAWFLAQTTH